ncbi:MAG: hypothetical protein FVQ83_04200 [Chloroflexi bacterium]|nr:hypothetical protein [Chloroflexota bacterium]
MRQPRKQIQLLICGITVIIAILACSLPESPEETPTAVAETLSATPTNPTATPTPEAEAPTAIATDAPLPTNTPVISTATQPPPPDGVSLNCDGTYQRFRLADQGINGKTVSIDSWDGNAWVNVWNVSSGDPNLQQYTIETGHYQFGECQRLVIVPTRYSNPQVFVELDIYVWNGAGMSLVYHHEGAYGEWSKAGLAITFEWASTLGWVNGGPLGPCEYTTLQHTWDGTAFNQTGSAVNPVPNCTPSAP